MDKARKLKGKGTINTKKFSVSSGLLEKAEGGPGREHTVDAMFTMYSALILKFLIRK